jgi:hypothetical protein
MSSGVRAPVVFAPGQGKILLLSFPGVSAQAFSLILAALVQSRVARAPSRCLPFEFISC